jgi:cellulose synthase/poly-beta-1,6-N-acetylglucosamine synthase-like glycosyltransferase
MYPSKNALTYQIRFKQTAMFATALGVSSAGLIATSAGSWAAGPPSQTPLLPPSAPSSNTSVTGLPSLPPVVPTAQHHLSVWAVLGISGLVAVSIALSLVAATTLSWMLHAWRTPKHLTDTRFEKLVAKPLLSFSLLVPARHEQAVLGETLDTLAAIRHPDFEVLAIIGHDDPETEAVARAAAERHPDRVRVVIDYSDPKNKPKALNTALAACRGGIVGVFDAEDEVHPDLIRHIDARFVQTGADVVQGGVQLMNAQTSWWSLRNCLEYYFWFRSRLHYHAARNFIPLGGNTVFTRTDLLREVGGWDPECLAEDCEIGVRLSSRGAVVAVAYEPEVVTREETPGSIRSLVKQRTRWNQGFLQVLGKGEWRKLPTRGQRLLARYTLSMPFLQAATGLLVPLSVALMFFTSVPTGIVLVTLLPIVPTIMTVAVEAAGYGEFCALYGLRRRLRDYVFLVVGAIPYQLLLAFAAMRAVVRQLRGDGSWEKTEHSNLHRVADAIASPIDSDLKVAS